jgi:hypothetical protein
MDKRFDRFVVCSILLLFVFYPPTAPSQTNYEILHDTLSATGWYGGDNGAGGPRTVGVGQGVRIDTSIILTDFSFHFDTRFDYVMNPDGFGHDVTLVLNIRDSSGVILQTVAILVSASFEGGWVTWTDINMSVDEGTLLIFTTYLMGAYDLNQYTSSHGSDQFALYTPGHRYSKDGTSDAQMEEWTDWGVHPWDSMFWLQGTIMTVGVNNEDPLPLNTILYQNYPNPFNPTTTFDFEIALGQRVSLRIFNLLGEEVETLVEEILPPGTHTRSWNAERMPTGMYFTQLRAGSTVVTRKVVLLR